MSYTDKKEVERLVKETDNNKIIPGKRKEKLFAYYNKAIESYFKYLSSLDAYEMGQVTNAIDHFLNDKKMEKPSEDDYRRGCIVLADFGFTNFGFEFSYPHPAIVLAQSRYHVFVVPCSTKKFGKGYSDVLDGYQSDGFEENTGVILNGMRWCSKTRLICKIATASKRILTQLDAFQLAKIPLYKELIEEKGSMIKKLQEENENLKKKLKRP